MPPPWRSLGHACRGLGSGPLRSSPGTWWSGVWDLDELKRETAMMESGSCGRRLLSPSGVRREGMTRGWTRFPWRKCRRQHLRHRVVGEPLSGRPRGKTEPESRPVGACPPAILRESLEFMGDRGRVATPGQPHRAPTRRPGQLGNNARLASTSALSLAERRRPSDREGRLHGVSSPSSSPA